VNAAHLKGRAIVTLSDAAKIGAVDDILFDSEYRQVLGFTLRHGPFGASDAVTRDRVSTVGQDALTVTGPDAVNTLDRLTTLTGASSLSQAQQTQVVTESGTLLGTISQVELDDEARTVVGYVLSTSLWKRMRHNAPRIAVQDVLRFGAAGIMIVADRVGVRLTSEAE
jgi:uncharacterized protein YrrD